MSAAVPALDVWDAEKWRKFLADQSYPNHDIPTDAELLGQQALGPDIFNTLLDRYMQEPLESFRKNFPNIRLGNLIRLCDAIKNYAQLHESQIGPESKIKTLKRKAVLTQHYSISKTPRIEIKALSDWHIRIRIYMYYFVRENVKENYGRRCVCAISPTMAVTYAHGMNRDCRRRLTNRGVIERRGSLFRLFSLQTGKEINAEVVSVNDDVDFMLLEAEIGHHFFDGDEGVHILEEPVIGQQLMVIGLSSETPSQENVTTGVVSSTGPFHNHKMMSDIIAWGGDSGGGLFSANDKLLGIVSSSKCDRSTKEFTRTAFSPAGEIAGAWERWMTDSGKLPQPHISDFDD